MIRYFLRFGYIGTKYRGTQVVHEFPNETVQDVIEQSLSQLDIKNTPVTHFASRTDKGVHALANALHVDLEHKIPGEVLLPHHIKKVLNAFFAENGHEILVKSASIVHNDFHARYSAKWRSYHYRLAILKPEISVPYFHKFCCQEYLPICEINRCHTVPNSLDISVVKQVTDMFCGAHNYGCFTKFLNRNPWIKPSRKIDECRFYTLASSKLIDDPQYDNIIMWEFFFRSRAFLHHQIRKLVGTALSAGFGRISLEDVQYMFDNPDPGNWKKCHMAPSCGLYLSHIEYDEKDFWTERKRIRKEITEESSDA